MRLSAISYQLSVFSYRCGAKLVLALLVLWTMDCGLSTCYADTYSSRYLIRQAKELDGKYVVYRGEAVTAVMRQGERAWVNVNDGENAIGVWHVASLLSTPIRIGNYKSRGDTLIVEGVFHRACPLHKGELDIHAEKMSVVEKGFAVSENMDRTRAVISAALFLLLLPLIILLKKKL